MLTVLKIRDKREVERLIQYKKKSDEPRRLI